MMLKARKQRQTFPVKQLLNITQKSSAALTLCCLHRESESYAARFSLISSLPISRMPLYRRKVLVI